MQTVRAICVGCFTHLIYRVFSGPSNRDAVFQFHASFLSINWGTKDSPALLGLEAEQKTMKIGRFCALLAFALFITFDGFAQNAVLNNSYVVHKDWDRQGVNQGMRFHLNLSVNDKKGQDVWCIIEIGYYDGEKIYYVSRSSGNYTYNGHLAISTKLTPSYDNSTWNDLQLFLPYNEFHQVYGEKSGYLIIRRIGQIAG